MPRVERPAIEPDIGTVTARLDEALRGIVTTLAQTLKWAAPEFVAVAMMRLNVIADSRRLHNAGLRAILAQRMFAQLVPTNSLPARRGVKIIPSRRPRTPMALHPAIDSDGR
jgi:hypothetical protein